MILDIVPNHTSHQHPFLLEANTDGEASPYWSYYDRNADGDANHYFDWQHLPNLNYQNPEVRQHIASTFKYWMNRFGVDGYRVDVAWGVRDRAADFFPKLRKELERVRPNTILLAEASNLDPYYVSNGFDYAYDWTNALGKWAWEPAFKNLERAGTSFEKWFSIPRAADDRTLHFLNNNDTGKRFITRYGSAIQKVASVLQFSIPGVPLLYMGDEVGAEYQPYEDPPVLDWHDQFGLIDHYRKLIRLRKRIPALYSGRFINLRTNGSARVYAFARIAEDARSRVVTVLNFGPTTRVSIRLPKSLRRRRTDESYCDLLSRKVIKVESVGERVQMRIPKTEAYLLTDESLCAAGEKF